MKAFEKIAVMAAILLSLVIKYVKAGCIPGTYGTEGDCRICPKNYYCPGDTTQPFQCPPGFASFDGETECFELTEEDMDYRLTRKLFACGSAAGWYCSGGSATECTDGYYCTGNGNQNICPTGYRCPKANTVVTCPSGYYSQNGWDECKI